MRYRKQLFALVLCLAALGAASTQRPLKKPDALAAGTQESLPKRVLLITIDTLRYDYLGCYGQQILKTPHIDSLSEQGVTFDHDVAQIPLTLPSHTSIMT